MIRLAIRVSKLYFLGLAFGQTLISPPLLATYVSLVDLLSFSVPQFPHLLNRLMSVIVTLVTCVSPLGK